MNVDIRPIEKTNLADDLSQRIMQMIRSGAYQPGDRLPAIMEMARSFGVGHPSLREALRKLETVGVVEIRHGSGVYVRRGQDVMLLSNPAYAGDISKKLLLDLVEARIPIEVETTALAATRATEEDLRKMSALLERAGASMNDDVVLNSANMAFHREIAAASGNGVLAQLLDVLTKLFNREQRLILDIYASRERDHREHLGILDALRGRDEKLARTRMHNHLRGVRAVLQRWNPDEKPVA